MYNKRNRKKTVKRPRRSTVKNIKRILMVSREYEGLAGAGGVKDVCRQLAEALVRHADCDVRAVLPCYGFMDAERREAVSLWIKKIQGVTVYLLASPRFAEKKGVYTYTAEEEANKSWQQSGTGHFDYFAMNALLQKATLDTMILLDFQPDIIHCHDGHAALLPAMMWENAGYRHFFCQTGAVVTIHNAGLGYHQEVADLDFAKAVTGLPESVIQSGLLNNCFDPFVAAAGYARMNTVSENYARELQETDKDSRTGGLGHELVKKGVELIGITNGINAEDFNPVNGKELGLAADFFPEQGELAGKRLCKNDILVSCRKNNAWSRVEQYGCLSDRPKSALFTFIGRLTAQKGVDVLLRAVSLLTVTVPDVDFQLLVLGNGDRELEEELRDLTQDENFSGRICFLQGYDPELAVKIYAGGDFFLIPSLYEPCGLTDYIAQLFGNLPVVHHVGGLVKVLDRETGFAYQEHTPDALAETMRQALSLYRDDPAQLIVMQKAAVRRILTHHSWRHVMEDYLALYQQAL
jgi:starch synthase